MYNLPFELSKDISKTSDINTIRLVNKELQLANMDRFCQHIIDTLTYKDIEYLYNNYQQPFVINNIYNDTYSIIYNDHTDIYHVYDTSYLPNEMKHRKTYRAGAYLGVAPKELRQVFPGKALKDTIKMKIHPNDEFELDLLSYNFLMEMKGCDDKQSRINILKDILDKKYNLTKTWSHQEYYSIIVDDHLWFMSNAIVMGLIDYNYDVFIIDYRKFNYKMKEEEHPRVLEEKQKLKSEIDMFYSLISSYLKTL